jgi:zinc transport system substrate-binding protein
MNRDIQIIDCGKGISLIDNDPHVWLSITNAAIMVENIYEGFIEIDPENKDFYYRNKNDFKAELSKLDEWISQTLEDKKNRKIMVYHPAWTYFADAYNLEQIPIEEEGKEPTMSGMRKIIEQARQYNIKVVFASPEISSKSAEVIASEIGGSVVLISPLEKDYIKNMENISEAFAASMQ